ncbi:MAG: hypothetical protein AB7T37_08970 [Dehalococcoidia bacterium]
MPTISSFNLTPSERDNYSRYVESVHQSNRYRFRTIAQQYCTELAQGTGKALARSDRDAIRELSAILEMSQTIYEGVGDRGWPVHEPTQLRRKLAELAKVLLSEADALGWYPR